MVAYLSLSPSLSLTPSLSLSPTLTLTLTLTRFFFVGGSNLWVTYHSLGSQAVPFAYAFDAQRGSAAPDFTELLMERQPDGTYALAHFSYQPPGGGRSDLDLPVPV